MKSIYFTNKQVSIPVKLKIHTDYDKLDAMAEKLGFENHGNDKDYCGWIATMGDEFHNPKLMLEGANQKLLNAQRNFKEAIIGFCQTGNFSVGYSIYTKN